MLTKEAFNALLKTLEEPPPHVIFIFATTEIHKIPPTVLSRCLLFDFVRVGADAIAGHLRAICEAEKIEIEDAAIDLIVFGSEGSIRDAISALDQSVNYAGEKITYDDALRALGLISRDVLHRFTNAVIEQNAEEAFAVVHETARTGSDMRLFCHQLIRHMRDLLVARVGGDGGAALLPYSDKEKELLREQSQRLSEEDLSRFFDILAKADSEMQLSATPQYHLEAAAVRMIHSTRLTPLTDLIARVQSGEFRGSMARAAPAPIEQRLEFDSPPRKGPSASADASARDRLLAAAKGSHIQRMLEMAGDVRLEGDNLLINLNSGVTYRALTNGENRNALNGAVRQAFGEEVKIEIKHADGGPVAEPDLPPLPPEEPVPPAEPGGDFPPAGDELQSKPADTGEAPVEAERKVKNDPLAGRLAQSLELTLDRAHDVEPEEEDGK